ncbi:MerR family transcriptional regulator [Magnetospirillum fulvum]|uniref:Regulatory protein, MerR n=1 Tax=Magnetospirillum fulvum MGU-K5 TaxID=1316936 RepID=S9SBI1_MAGFU|nr:MerR family transcriptional regulator [Magnetospirillum fulvum]EPY02059.1 regulatory protein, MerR [Magnetospirillum fulvum MGU-K5]
MSEFPPKIAADPTSPHQPDSSGAAVSIAAIEKETGLTKEVVRKWETRYGFPCPDRDENGDRIYPAEQVDRLRLIRRLIGAGLRPGKVVGLDMETLERMVWESSPSMSSQPTDFSLQVLDTVLQHDIPRLKELFKQQWGRDGLADFIGKTLSELTLFIGEAWLRGDIRMFEEHIYTEAVLDVLHDAIRTVSGSSGWPRVLMSTAPGEVHTIGLLMAEAMLSMEGASCIRLGSQIPMAELVAAITACEVDIVGLSFSIAYPARNATQFLNSLRSRLDPSVEIWVGGLGVTRLKPMAGVRFLDELDEIGPALAGWRSEHKAQAPVSYAETRPSRIA